MKLNIGENIRKYRRNKDITQEQFADKIGVSFQAVSRWENGITYPDMELLPIIAKFFNVSVDRLLSCPDDKREEAAKVTIENLRVATSEEPINTGEIIKLIRDIRNNYLDSEAFYYFWFVKLDTYCLPDILPEVRLTAEMVLEGNYPQYIKSMAIEYFSKIEDEDNIESFLDKYATEADTSRTTLLRNRYRAKCDWENAEYARQVHLMNLFDDLIGTPQCWRCMTDAHNVDEAIATSEIMLEMLNKLNAQKPDEQHPVSGNGEVDFWVEDRIIAGFTLSCALGMKGRKDEAFIVLEDTVSLIEKVMAITETTTLVCTSPWLKDMKWTAQRMPANEHFSEHIWIVHQSGLTFFIAPNIYYKILLTNPSFDDRFKWFESLQNDTRYQEYIDRLKKLIK